MFANGTPGQADAFHVANGRLLAPASGQPNWGDEPLGFPLSGGECDTCHSIPKLTMEYCAAHKKAVGKTMPPPPDKVAPGYGNGVKKLKEERNKRDPGLNWS